MTTPETLLDFPCPNCGAHLVVDGSTQTPVCTYCETQTLLPEHIWLRFHPAPPAPAADRARTPWRGMIFAGVAVASVVLVGVVALLRDASAPAAKTPLKPTATAGDPCNGRHAACSGEKNALLVCGPDDTMVVSETCKGPSGCNIPADGTTVSCDTTLADPSDACTADTSSCSTDHKAELRCQASHFAVISTCKGPDGCMLTPSTHGAGYTMSCDDHIADVGDPCFDSDRTACSSDKTAYLNCTKQRFAVDHKCKHGCTVRKIAGTSNVAMTCK